MREGLALIVAALVISDLSPVNPAFQSRHSRFLPPSFPRRRESSQARHPKSGANSERQIPSPLMGEG